MTDAPPLSIPYAAKAALDERLGIEYLEAEPGRVVARMPVEGNTQPFGLLHGGASCALAESLGSVAAAIHAMPAAYPVGVDINATHHRGVRAGFVTGVATPIHEGRATATYAISISDDDGRPVCTARITCFLRPINQPTSDQPRSDQPTSDQPTSDQPTSDQTAS